MAHFKVTMRGSSSTQRILAIFGRPLTGIALHAWRDYLCFEYRRVAGTGLHYFLAIPTIKSISKSSFCSPDLHTPRPTNYDAWPVTGGVLKLLAGSLKVTYPRVGDSRGH